MTYIQNDTDIANHMTSNCHTILGTAKINGLDKKLAFPEHDGAMARERDE